MKKFKKLCLVALITVAAILAMSCGKKEEATTEEVTTTEEVATEESNEAPEGMVANELTGEWIDESLSNQRPLTCMINNLKPAMPQSGIGQADIVYEMLVEGGITRLMGVYKDYSKLEKLGPIRSSRHYYVEEAMEYDAIYAHVGQSVFAEEKIASTGINNINGLYNSMIFRDKSRVAPHNAYTNSENIAAAIKEQKYRTEYDTTFSKDKFVFAKDDTELADGEKAEKITTAFNSNRKPWFEYDSENKVYKRFQYGDKQIDAETDEQLTYKNVIIQFCPHAPLLEELIDITLTGEGTGYYATDGKVIPITWKKSGDGDTCKYYTEDGKQLEMNVGKTWITIFPDDQKGDITFE